MRLGLYNVQLEKSKTDEGDPEHYFSGIPTPVGAILIMLPLTHSFMGYNWAYENLNFVAGYIILISGLLVSRIPTFSIKRKQLIIQSKLRVLILFSIIALSIINFLWITVNILALIYLFTIPISIIAWQNSSNRDSA